MRKLNKFIALLLTLCLCLSLSVGVLADIDLDQLLDEWEEQTEQAEQTAEAAAETAAEAGETAEQAAETLAEQEAKDAFEYLDADAEDGADESGNEVAEVIAAALEAAETAKEAAETASEAAETAQNAAEAAEYAIEASGETATEEQQEVIDTAKEAAAQAQEKSEAAVEAAKDVEEAIETATMTLEEAKAFVGTAVEAAAVAASAATEAVTSAAAARDAISGLREKAAAAALDETVAVTDEDVAYVEAKVELAAEKAAIAEELAAKAAELAARAEDTTLTGAEKEQAIKDAAVAAQEAAVAAVEAAEAADEATEAANEAAGAAMALARRWPSEEKTLTRDAGDYTVTVTVPEGAFAERAYFRVFVVEWAYLDGETAALLKAEGLTEDDALLDIGFDDADGAEIEPDLPLTVGIASRAVEIAEVWHVEDAETATQVAESAEEAAEFEVESCSYFVVKVAEDETKSFKLEFTSDGSTETVEAVSGSDALVYTITSTSPVSVKLTQINGKSPSYSNNLATWETDSQVVSLASTATKWYTGARKITPMADGTATVTLKSYTSSAAKAEAVTTATFKIKVEFDVPTVDENDAVAKVGDKYYGTLDNAVLVAPVGSTVTLTRSIPLTSSLTVNKDLTIDLAGETLSSSVSNAIQNTKDGCTITIKNGTISSTNYNVIYSNGTSNAKLTNSVINLENLTVTSTDYPVVVSDQYGGSINISGDKTVIEYTGSTFGYYSTYVIGNSGAGTISISGGTVKCMENYVPAKADKQKVYTIYNGSTGTVHVSGGTVKASPVLSADSSSGGGINAAIYNYNKAGTIEITGSAEVTASANASHAIYNANAGTINISGGQIESSGSPVLIRTSAYSASTAIYNASSGTVNISGGTITGSADGLNISGKPNETGSCAIWNGSGTVNVTGGKIEATGGRSYAVYSNGANAGVTAVTVNGGTVMANAKNGSYAIYNTGTVNGFVSIQSDTVSGTVRLVRVQLNVAENITHTTSTVNSSTTDYFFGVPASHKVTFVNALSSQSLTTMDEKDVEDGETVTPPTQTTLVDTGSYPQVTLTLIGWFTEANTYDEAKIFDFATPITEDTTLYARWGFVITFATGYDDTELSREILPWGGEITIPSNPEREHYTFDGWSWSVPYGTSIDSGKPIMLHSDVTVTARWKPIEYTVTFYDEDGETVLKEQTVPHGTTPAYDGPEPSKHGDAQYSWYFAGWDRTLAPATEDTSYTATYSRTVNTYTVTWVVEGETVETDAGVAYGETVSYDGETPAKAATAQYTYTFSGWGFPDGEAPTVSGDATYTAQFSSAVNAYAVTFDSDGGSEVETQSVNYGETATEPAAPARAGYTFAGWTLDGADYDFATPITGNVALTAAWTEIVVPTPPTPPASGDADYGYDDGGDDDTTTILDENVPLDEQPGETLEIEEQEVPLSQLPLAFADVALDAWYHDAVAYAWNAGLMQGDGESFMPDAATSRAQIATILMRMSGAGDADTTYDEAMAWAKENGIIIDDTVSASADVTRQQLVTILYRYAQLRGYDVSASAELSGFGDAEAVSEYAKDAMAWAVAAGLIRGDGMGLNPVGNATRAEIATILMRFDALNE